VSPYDTLGWGSNIDQKSVTYYLNGPLPVAARVDTSRCVEWAGSSTIRGSWNVVAVDCRIAKTLVRPGFRRLDKEI